MKLVYTLFLFLSIRPSFADNKIKAFISEISNPHCLEEKVVSANNVETLASCAESVFWKIDGFFREVLEFRRNIKFKVLGKNAYTDFAYEVKSGRVVVSIGFIKRNLGKNFQDSLYFLAVALSHEYGHHILHSLIRRKKNYGFLRFHQYVSRTHNWWNLPFFPFRMNHKEKLIELGAVDEMFADVTSFVLTEDERGIYKALNYISGGDHHGHRVIKKNLEVDDKNYLNDLFSSGLSFHLGPFEINLEKKKVNFYALLAPTISAIHSEFDFRKDKRKGLYNLSRRIDDFLELNYSDLKKNALKKKYRQKNYNEKRDVLFKEMSDYNRKLTEFLLD